MSRSSPTAAVRELRYAERLYDAARAASARHSPEIAIAPLLAKSIDRALFASTVAEALIKLGGPSDRRLLLFVAEEPHTVAPLRAHLLRALGETEPGIARTATKD